MRDAAVFYGKAFAVAVAIGAVIAAADYALGGNPGGYILAGFPALFVGLVGGSDVIEEWKAERGNR